MRDLLYEEYEAEKRKQRKEIEEEYGKLRTIYIAGSGWSSAEDRESFNRKVDRTYKSKYI